MNLAQIKTGDKVTFDNDKVELFCFLSRMDGIPVPTKYLIVLP